MQPKNSSNFEPAYEVFKEYLEIWIKVDFDVVRNLYEATIFEAKINTLLDNFVAIKNWANYLIETFIPRCSNITS